MAWRPGHAPAACSKPITGQPLTSGGVEPSSLPPAPLTAALGRDTGLNVRPRAVGAPARIQATGRDVRSRADLAAEAAVAAASP